MKGNVGEAACTTKLGWKVEAPLVLVAVRTGRKIPAVVGVPDRTPLVDRVIPGGRLVARTERESLIRS